MENRTFTPRSTIRELLSSPIGHDVIAKMLLQTGKSMKLVDNPVVGRLRLSQLRRVVPKMIDDGFMATLLGLLNSEHEAPLKTAPQPAQAWWKEAVVYQVYPRSFMDSNGDGVGDLVGIASKLDYLKALGVDVIWLSPIYDSPNDDNGYDIRDYRAIMREFGDMADFDGLLEQVHAHGMKLIMDLVVNHTSDEHAWFLSALQGRGSPCHDYYIWKKSGVAGQPPNNWDSFFGGSAWNYYEDQDEWALHLFSKKQMDLNWESPALRAEIYDMVNWWLSKGVDGFRLDVISYISKAQGLPDGNAVIGKMMGCCGVEHYFYGPRLHEYLRELRGETFDRFDVFTVGESPGTGMEMSKLLTADYRRELDMVFSFDHLENPGKTRFDDYCYDLNHLKKVFSDWQLNYGDNCWNALFLENHDNPRMISKVNPSPEVRIVLGKLLAMLQLTLKGTPFIYQGQELGMVNADFTAPGQLRDVESVNLFNELLGKAGEENAMKKVNAGSRDHARTPMQWSGGPNAGFTAGEPWLAVNSGYTDCNAEAEERDGGSVLNYYRELIALRHGNKALVYGRFTPVRPKTRGVFCYFREFEGARFYIELNLTEREQPRPFQARGFERLLSNYPEPGKRLRPYEAAIYRCGD